MSAPGVGVAQLICGGWLVGETPAAGEGGPGGVLSTRKGMLCVLVLPTSSVAVTRRRYVPSVVPVVSHVARNVPSGPGTAVPGCEPAPGMLKTTETPRASTAVAVSGAVLPLTTPLVPAPTFVMLGGVLSM